MALFPSSLGYRETFVHYKTNHLRVMDGSITPKEIIASMSDIFPELRYNTTYESVIEFGVRHIYLIRLEGGDSHHVKGGRGLAHQDATEGRFVTIGDEYADKGNYQHLVGKKALVEQEIVELNATFVKTDGQNGETKTYIIRNIDCIGLHPPKRPRGYTMPF
jgi:hypothetical protein